MGLRRCELSACMTKEHAQWLTWAYSGCMRVQGGGVMVHVGGHFRVGGSGPLALGPQGAGPPSPFSEAFLIRREAASGRAVIVNQSFQLL